MIELVLQLEIVSPHHCGHWTKNNHRNKQNCKIIRWNWLALPLPRPKAPCKIYLERIWSKKHKQKRMDYDRLVGSLTGVRDCIAELINPDAVVYYLRKGKMVKNPGHADNDVHGIEFFYEQTESDFKAVKIKIEVGECVMSSARNAVKT